MKENLLIVEDEYIVANDLRIILQQAGYSVCGIADSVDGAKKSVEKFKPTWVLLDIFLKNHSMGTELAPYLHEHNIGFIYISANTNQTILEIAKATQPYGFMIKPFREKDLLIMLDIVRGKHQTNLQFLQQRELMLHTQLKDFLDGILPFDHLVNKLPAVLQSVIPFDLLLYTFSPAGNLNRTYSGFFRVGFNEYQLLSLKDNSNADTKPNEAEFVTGVYNDGVFAGLAAAQKDQKDIAIKYGLKSALKVSFKIKDDVLDLIFYSKKIEGYNQSNLQMLQKSEKWIIPVFELINAGPKDNQPVVFRRASRVQPAPEVKPNGKFDGIFGNSAPLLEVLDNIEMVANTPVTVLILGESGTGKEKVAQNIHELSNRKGKPFVTVNCAALPADLIESELFGHERGAFTGAVEKRSGKFEQANGGTIFLDEIGELPLESQVKLLRVLQEKTFEHIGGSKTTKVDIRVLAATNKNLEKEVAEGRFRLDLFYRLNVFPIEVPPLRDRKSDIPVLARHFLAKSSSMMGRPDVPELSPEALKQLNNYNWPGNIRELEHMMERTVIRNSSKIIREVSLPKPDAAKESGADQNSVQKTLEQIETEHILYVLKECSWKIFGAGGAAEILGLPPSTLTSRIKKLGIKKELYYNK